MVCAGVSIGVSSSSKFFQPSHTPSGRSRRSAAQVPCLAFCAALAVGVHQPLHLVEGGVEALALTDHRPAELVQGQHLGRQVVLAHEAGQPGTDLVDLVDVD